MPKPISKEEKIEKRRFRAATAAHIASALVRTFGEDDPNAKRIAWIAVNVADAVIQRLDETDPFKD